VGDWGVTARLWYLRQSPKRCLHRPLKSIQAITKCLRCRIFGIPLGRFRLESYLIALLRHLSMALQEISPSKLDCQESWGYLARLSRDGSEQTNEVLKSFVHALATSICLRRPARESLLMSTIAGDVLFERGFHLILLDSHLRISGVLLPSPGLAPPLRC
jgi:hypothetical protein